MSPADSLFLLVAGLTLLGAAGLLRLARLEGASRETLAAADAAGDMAQALARDAERAIGGQIAELRAATERRLGEAAAGAAREQGEARAHLERKLREIAEANAAALADITRTVNAELHRAVEQQMQASFTRVLDQFAAVQKAVGDVQAVAAQVGDLKRVFANVKTRGGWGEAHLRALLDDMLPEAYDTNIRLRHDSAEAVEFALRLPDRDGGHRKLPLDAKFPVADYERLIAAAEAGDTEAERAARRALETRFRLEARKIAEKYIVPPLTTDFAVMYLPTDGLYAEAARIPGLIDELGRTHHVMVMGPSLLPALLRTVRLGHVTLALEARAGEIGKLLGATRQEMLRMDEALERLARGAGTLARGIEETRARTRGVTERLRELET